MNKSPFREALSYWSKQPKWAIKYEIKHCYMLLRVRHWTPETGFTILKKERARVRRLLVALYCVVVMNILAKVKKNKWALLKTLGVCSLILGWYYFLICFTG